MEYNKINRVGEYHLTNQGYLAKIIEYFGNSNCTIQFENGSVVKNIHYSKLNSYLWKISNLIKTKYSDHLLVSLKIFNYTLLVFNVSLLCY